MRDGAATTAPRVRYDRRARTLARADADRALPNRYLLAVSHDGDGRHRRPGRSSSGPTRAPRAASAAARPVSATIRRWRSTRTRSTSASTSAAARRSITLSVRFDVALRAAAQLGAGRVDDRSDRVRRLVATPTAPGIYAPQGVTNFDDNTDAGLRDRRRQPGQGPAGAAPDLEPRRDADAVGRNRRDPDVDPTGDPIDVPHPGGVLPLDGLDHRLGQAVIRNGRLWTSHHFEVDSFGEADANGNRNGVRWYELTALTGHPAQVQSGTVWDPAGANPASYWLGAIMPSGQGHVALGHVHGRDPAAGQRRRHRPAGRRRDRDDGRRRRSSRANTAFTYNLQGAPATDTGVEPDVVDEPRPRRRHDAVDAAAVRRRPRLVGPAAGAPPGAAAGVDRGGVAEHAGLRPDRCVGHRDRDRRSAAPASSIRAPASCAGWRRRSAVPA